MSNLEKRIDNLERQAVGKGITVLVHVYEGQEAPRSPTEAEKDAAIAAGYVSNGLLQWDSEKEKFIRCGGAK